MPDICISLISTNTKELLRACLQSIYSGAPSLSVETWVVDNASTDGTSEMLRTDFPQIHIITNAKREGYGANHNKVIQKSNARYVLVLNEDTQLLQDTLEAMVGFMDSHLDAGASSPKVFFGNGCLQRNAGRFPTLWGEFLHFGLNIAKNAKRGYEGYKFMEDWDYGDTRVVDWVSGCFLLIRRDAVSRIGGFHRDIFIYFEDVEWCYRLKRETQWRTYFVTQTSIVHYHGQSFDPLRFDRELFAFKGVLVYLRTAYGEVHSTMFRIICKFLWTVYFFSLSVVVALARSTKGKLNSKLAFYRYLLFEGK